MNKLDFTQKSRSVQRKTYRYDMAGGAWLATLSPFLSHVCLEHVGVGGGAGNNKCSTEEDGKESLVLESPLGGPLCKM